jgi:transposase
VLDEYGKVVNFFIEKFWPTPPRKSELLKPIVDSPTTWLSARLRKVAAREAIDMIRSFVERDGDEAKQPAHKGERMHVLLTIASLAAPKKASEFDAWLQLRCLGENLKLDIPIKFHDHYNEWSAAGKRLESYIITREYVQFAFEIETGPKRTSGGVVGVDTGIKALASTSDGQQFGTDIEDHIDRINRCQHGSNGQRRARRALRQRMDEVVKQMFAALGPLWLVVVEKLKNLNYKTKQRRRLCKSMRRSIGAWAWRYWLGRIERECEHRRSVFRSVPAYYTSQTCPACGLVDRRNRDGEVFLCRACGHTDNADINAAKNILSRFLTGPYGAGFQAEPCQ